MQLFKVCSIPQCGSIIDPEDVSSRTVGAAVIVNATCLNNHAQTWSSSNLIGEGHERMYAINILLAAFTLFCGLNVSQVSYDSVSAILKDHWTFSEKIIWQAKIHKFYP